MLGAGWTDDTTRAFISVCAHDSAHASSSWYKYASTILYENGCTRMLQSTYIMPTEWLANQEQPSALFAWNQLRTKEKTVVHRMSCSVKGFANAGTTAGVLS